jgi:hypothetical protein
MDSLAHSRLDATPWLCRLLCKFALGDGIDNRDSTESSHNAVIEPAHHHWEEEGPSPVHSPGCMTCNMSSRYGGGVGPPRIKVVSNGR